jgi:hypothetical protein
MHELDWLFPAALCKEEDSEFFLWFWVKRRFRTHPFLGSVDTLPFDALAGRKLNNLHVIEAALVEPELV